MWGTDMTQTITIREGTANVFVAVEHSNSELVGIHCSATNWMRGRIAPPELLPKTGPLPHLICSRQSNLGSGDEEGEHGDTSGIDFGDQGALRLGRAAGKGKD